MSQRLGEPTADCRFGSMRAHSPDICGIWPSIAAENKVDEAKAGDRGEVSDLNPGTSGTLTVALQPGKYLLICNEAGHFAAGMWTTFEVTK